MTNPTPTPGPQPFDQGGAVPPATAAVNDTGQPVQVAASPDESAQAVAQQYAPPTADTSSPPEPQPSTEVAITGDQAPAPAEVLDPSWPHTRLEFKGDDLAIRKPKRQAAVALHLASVPHAPEGAADNLSGLLIARMLGPQSYSRVMFRMMDPDDADYTDATITELVQSVMKLASEEWDAETDSAGETG